MFPFLNKSISDNSKTLFDFKINSISGDELNLSVFKGHTMLLVNVASNCGFTKQYDDLQKLYDNYKDLVECPSFNPQNDNSGPVFVTKLPFRQLAESFNEQFNVSVNIPDKYPVPTKFVSMDIDSVDVAVTTRTGTFTKCKQWPYFNELFFLFDKYF